MVIPTQNNDLEESYEINFYTNDVLTSGAGDYEGSGDVEHRTYYTGVAGSTDFIRFIEANKVMSNDKLFGVYEQETLELSDYGLTSDDWQDKKAFVILRGFDANVGTTWLWHDGDVDVEKLALDVNLDDPEVSDGKVNVYTFGMLNSAPEYLHPIAINVYYTIVLYDPDYISVTPFEVNNYDTSSDHSFSIDKAISVTTASPDMVLPNSFDTSDGEDAKNDNVLGFVGLYGWWFEDDESMAIHRIKARAELDKWVKNSATTGIATVEVVGAMSRYECGLVNNYNVKPSPIKGYVILCRDDYVCNSTFEYTDYSSSGNEDYTVTMKKTNVIKAPIVK
jgi:hypothetical protein